MAAEFPQPEPGHAKVCHYAILAVERTAAPDEIKRAYRKAAMRWHPDKNRDAGEDAARFFLLVQEAYEVLSDPQERSWYDSHRLAILKRGAASQASSGGGDEASEDGPDWLYAYFSASCHPDTANPDSAKGFFGVYAAVFQKIAATEAEERQQQDEDAGRPTAGRDYAGAFPELGDSKSGFEAVRAFYQFWGQFVSCRSFSWADPWELTQAPGRKVRRLMEAENKKARSKARKDYNSVVRQLVQFVRKRDPRVAQAQIAADREAVKRKREEQQRAEQQRRAVERSRAEHRQRQEELREQQRQAYIEAYGEEPDSDDESDYDSEDDDHSGSDNREQENQNGDVSDEVEDGEVASARSNRPKGAAAVSLDSSDEEEEQEEAGRRPRAAKQASPKQAKGKGKSKSKSKSGKGKQQPQMWACRVCSKTFKSDPPFQQHLKTKKHRQELAALGLTPKEEQMMLFGDAQEDEAAEDDEEDEEAVADDNQGGSAAAAVTEDLPADEIDDEVDDVLAEMLLQQRLQGGGRNKKKNRGRAKGGYGILDSDAEAETEPAREESVVHEDGELEAKQQEEKASAAARDSDDEDEPASRRKGKGKGKAKKKSEKAPPKPKSADARIASAVASAGGRSEKQTGVCKTCGKVFPSRSKLFQHLEESGHAAIKR